jgi:outer membrane protein OmpA-like peptidoglycan-associated protein
VAFKYYHFFLFITKSFHTMANLLDSFKEYLTPDLIGQAATMLGEEQSGVGKALGGIAPVILSGLLNKTSDSSAMGTIFNQLSNFDSGILNNLGGLLGGGNLSHNDPKDLAGNLMGNLFGPKVPAILNALSSFAGIKSSSVSSLLGVAGPAVMALLGKRIKGEGLNISGLANLLLGEKSSIMNALPAGMSTVLGMSDAGDGTSRSRSAGPIVTESDTAPTGGGRNWLLPLLLLAAALLGLMYALKNCNAPKVEIPPVKEVKKEEPTVDNTVKTVVYGFMHKLTSGFELKGNKDGIESSLVAFIEDANRKVDKTTWFNFDRLTFRTGSAEIDMDKSKEQLTNIYEVMKAYPKVKLKIGGYTDNTGNAADNLKLSLARARATLTALEAMGVEKGRLSAEGYGSQFPVASNDTEEGRAQNRRIAVRVTEK